jgi:sulfatase modifying factor 1
VRARAKRAVVLGLVVGAAACGLFPDLSTLEGADGSAMDAAHDVVMGSDASDASVKDAAGDVDADSAMTSSCPSAHGAAMVKVDPTTCIDSTEVTVAHYRAFVSSIDGGVAQTPVCASNASFTPLGGIPGPTHNSEAITGLSWCQAEAFCTWAGKALCGAPDGGSFAFTSYADPAQSVWMRACSANGTQSYPYGNVFKSGACNVPLTPDAAVGIAAVASFTQCDGSVPGLYDMIGNVTEWENACQTSGGDAAADLCRRRGAGYDEPANASLGTCSWDEADSRDHQGNTSGARCCAILP